MAEKLELGELEVYLTDLLEKEVILKIDTFDDILSRRALQLRGKLRDLSPERTGNYRKGWRIKAAQRNHEKVRIIYNANRPDLTWILEYGTAHQKAQPHIRRAIEETYDEIMEELLNRL